MSRQLPIRPNLDHLRKQAKRRLEELRGTRSGATLADALHAIARDYGFATWPRLKAHVESLLAPEASADPSATQASPALSGVWDVDQVRSTLHPLNAFRSATLQFEVDGDVVTIEDLVVDEAGRDERNRNTLHADGQVREGPHGYSTVARWRDARTLEAVVSRDGRIEARVVYAVAADDRTLTLTAGDYVALLHRRRERDDTARQRSV